MGYNYSDEPTRVERADMLPDIEELQPRPVPHTPSVSESVPHSGTEGGSTEAPQEVGSSVVFTIGKFNDFLQWFLMVLEVTLLLRFIFKLIGVNAGNGFVQFLYSLTDIFLFLFNGIVPPTHISASQSFEWPTLIGMAIYALIVFALRRFLRIIISEPEEPVG